MNAQRPTDENAQKLAPATPGVTGAAGFAEDLDAWTAAVRDCEQRCAEHGFGAAVVSIGLRGRGPVVDRRRRALAVLAAELRSTDVVGTIADDELAVVLIPLEGIEAAQRRVNALDRALAADGLDVAVGWAMRLEGHGLFHAAARADAALVSARHRSGDRSLDLTAEGDPSR